MSETTLSELVESRLEIEAWRAYRHEQQPWIAMFDARIRMAEAAERVAEAFEAAYAIGGRSADDGVLAAVYKQYAAAREAVRKLEETQS